MFNHSGDGKLINNIVRTFRVYKNIVKFIMVFILGVTVMTLIFQVFSFGYYGTLVGYTSMSIEATLGLPQLITNYTNKNVKGLSFIMIFSWFIGTFRLICINF